MRYWLDVHAPMALNIPGMTGMVCAEVLGPTRRRLDIPRGEEIEIDGIAESWKLESNYPSNPDAPPEARAWYNDGPKFVGQIRGFRVRENVIMRPRRGGKGLVSLLNRKPEHTREQFEQHWVGVHGPMARNVPEVEGLILNQIERVASRDDIPPLHGYDDIDGIAESWHVDQSYPGVTSPEGQAWYADGASHIGMARGYFTQEHVIIEPR
ncbi:MAG: EthD domain-containing protein [Terricaulis sp.]|nr:EthD domain-containing protein [Terricaulis sp.]